MYAYQRLDGVQRLTGAWEHKNSSMFQNVVRPSRYVNVFEPSTCPIVHISGKSTKVIAKVAV